MYETTSGDRRELKLDDGPGRAVDPRASRVAGASSRAPGTAGAGLSKLSCHARVDFGRRGRGVANGGGDAASATAAAAASASGAAGTAGASGRRRAARTTKLTRLTCATGSSQTGSPGRKLAGIERHGRLVAKECKAGAARASGAPTSAAAASASARGSAADCRAPGCPSATTAALGD